MSVQRRGASFAFSLFFASQALGAAINTTRRASSSNVNFADFEADSSIDVAALYAFVKAGSGKVLASYPTCSDCDSAVNVDLHDQSDAMAGVFNFMADMDIDCDGVNWQCPGNPDGQPQTDFGAMDTYQAPWYVIPDDFISPHDVQPNALGAIICAGKMYYGVFADSNGDTPLVIGEGSMVLGSACFPSEGLSGDNGHPGADVAYIVFGSDVPDGVGKETLQYGPLKQLGDQKVKELMSKLTLGSTAGPPTQPAPGESSSTSATPTSSSDPEETQTQTQTQTQTDGEPTSTPTDGGDGEDAEPTPTDSAAPTPTDSAAPTQTDSVDAPSETGKHHKHHHHQSTEDVSTSTDESGPTSTDTDDSQPTETGHHKHHGSGSDDGDDDGDNGGDDGDDSGDGDDSDDDSDDDGDDDGDDSGDDDGDDDSSSRKTKRSGKSSTNLRWRASIARKHLLRKSVKRSIRQRRA